MPKKTRPTVVYVEWFDASYQRGECEESDLVCRVELRSAGILIREDDESISLALDSYEGDKTWRHIEHIPKVNVKLIRKFKT